MTYYPMKIAYLQQIEIKYATRHRYTWKTACKFAAAWKKSQTFKCLLLRVYFFREKKTWVGTRII